MKGCLGLFLLLAISAFILGASHAQAEGEVLLGNGCYVIPTTSTLVKVLVGAEEKDGILVAQLTNGEIWVLKAFFSLSVSETSLPEELDLCIRNI